jgi:hypothetical protein
MDVITGRVVRRPGAPSGSRRRDDVLDAPAPPESPATMRV